MPYVYVYNYSGTTLDIEATATNCTQTFNGVNNVCSYAEEMPSRNRTLFFLDPTALQTGVQAQATEEGGPAPLIFHPLETGQIVINERSGALEFKPGAPDGGAKLPTHSATGRKKKT
jgi:hypothetical protein